MSSKSAWVYNSSLQFTVPTSAQRHLRLVLHPFQCILLLPVSSLSMRIHDHTCISALLLLLLQVPCFPFPFSLQLITWKVNIHLCFKGIKTQSPKSLKKELRVNNGGQYASNTVLFFYW